MIVTPTIFLPPKLLFDHVGYFWTPKRKEKEKKIMWDILGLAGQ